MVHASLNVHPLSSKSRNRRIIEFCKKIKVATEKFQSFSQYENMGKYTVAGFNINGKISGMLTPSRLRTQVSRQTIKQGSDSSGQICSYFGGLEKFPKNKRGIRITLMKLPLDVGYLFF